MNRHDPLAGTLSAAGSRYRLNTPALVLDLDAFEGNVRAMAESCRGFGIGMRPHAKTHKSSMIGRRQIEAGARGICCATLDEAEVLAQAGVPGLLITAPLVSAEKIARLLQIMRTSPDVMVIVDNPLNVDALDRAASDVGQRLNVIVDLDIGNHRTGVQTAADAVRLAADIASRQHLAFAGLQAYGGQLQHITDYAARQDRTHSADQLIRETVAALTANGLKPAIVTGAGTGTHRIDGEAGPFTELQVGSYIFMDADYSAVEYAPGQNWPFRFALFVQAMVISTNVPGTVTVDAGTKAFALNGPKPRVVSGPLADARYEFAGDEHGRLHLPDALAPPEIGARVEFIVPHCDPTVALYDFYHCVRGDRIVESWPVDARGRRS